MFWLLVLILAVIVGLWVYANRAAGVAAILVAPLLWLALFVVVDVAVSNAAQVLTVSGYTHSDPWVSMNDNPHAESWQVDFASHTTPFWLALALPLAVMLVLRTIDKWQLRNFILLAMVGWPFLLLDSGSLLFGGTGSHEYSSQAELPPIGSRVDASGLPYEPAVGNRR